MLTVPIGALFRRGDDWAVFAISGGRVHTERVELGQRSDTAAQVTRGLEAGQPIVLHPPDTLADGARVTARAAS